MKKTLIVAVAMALPVIAEASPWLPIPGSTQLSVGIVNQAGDEFYLGTEKVTLPDKIKQNTYSIGAHHGLTDQLAIDAQLNYARISFGTLSESAIGDSSIGIKWRVFDEFESSGTPTLTLRAAANIAGNYEVGKIDAIGDGASGIELAALAGKYLLPNFTIAGELGYRYRNHDVPADIWVGADVGYSMASFVSLSAGFTATRSQGDLDIAGPGFTPARFPELREDRDLVKIGAAFSISPRVSLNVNYAQVISGRNTTKADIWGISVATSF